MMKWTRRDRDETTRTGTSNTNELAGEVGQALSNLNYLTKDSPDVFDFGGTTIESVDEVPPSKPGPKHQRSVNPTAKRLHTVLIGLFLATDHDLLVVRDHPSSSPHNVAHRMRQRGLEVEQRGQDLYVHRPKELT